MAKSLEDPKNLLDPRDLIENCGNKRELAHRVLRAYLRVSPALVSRILTGAEASDADEVRIGAHTLRGSSATIGAKALADLCKRIESAPLATSREELMLFNEHFDLTVGEIQRYLEEPA